MSAWVTGLAADMARQVFDKRSAGKRQRNVEAHIRESELAAIIEAAIILALKHPREAAP